MTEPLRVWWRLWTLERIRAGGELRFGAPVADALTAGRGERLFAVGHWQHGHQGRRRRLVDVLPENRVAAIGACYALPLRPA